MIISRRELIKKYLDFFKSKNHAVIPNTSLIPKNDPTVLFTTAGMHPLVPYLLGQKHPLGKRLVNVQKCIRTTDIDAVGDETHHTFFEMLGNWSLGDYFKKEAINLSFEFLTKELKIPKEKISVTCFKGDKDAAKDDESAEIWESLGISKNKIKFLGKEDNWWGPAGKTGPCGPDTEMFVNEIEIWNDVFMQYNKNKNGKYEVLTQKNVDTGMGVERTISILNNLKDNYLNPVWKPIIEKIEQISGKKYGKNKEETRSIRIIADHIKASVFLLAENITPSNVEQGYVLRRLIRRAIRYGRLLEIKRPFAHELVPEILGIYTDYPELKQNKKFIIEELKNEEARFARTIDLGLKIAERIFKTKIPIKRDKYTKFMQLANHIEILNDLWKKKREGKRYNIKKVDISEKEIDKATITGKEGFLLYQSYGFPPEMIIELATEKNLIFHRGEFKRKLQKHQELSRTASQGRFKSGLADSSEKTTRLHTATHLLNQALKQVLKDKNIKQKGSNINPERLRFDFNFSRKLTDKEIKDIENLVNEKIKHAIAVEKQEMKLKDAIKSSAESEFGAKYPDIVSVYSIGNFSKEICTGPHVSNTKEIGKFKIIKEESVAAGIRRIKAVVYASGS